MSDAELERLHAGGIRGIRFTLYTPMNAATDFAMVEPLAQRVHAFGWHVQLHWNADQIVEHAALLARLPCTIVLDHLARLPLPDALAHPALRRRAPAARQRPHLDQAVRRLPGFACGRGRRLRRHDRYCASLGAAGTRPRGVGSDWPHPTERTAKPDDAQLFDLLGQWVPDEAARRRVLVDNPARLYDFS